LPRESAIVILQFAHSWEKSSDRPLCRTNSRTPHPPVGTRHKLRSLIGVGRHPNMYVQCSVLLHVDFLTTTIFY